MANVNILGYSALAHDPSVAVMCGPKILCAVESEKVTRHKHELNVFPEQAIRFALETASLNWEDLDVIAVNYDAGPISNFFYLPHLWQCFKARNVDIGIVLNAIIIAGSHNRRFFTLVPEYRLPGIVKVRHHRAHVASSFPYSPFEEAAVAIIDAAGELECTSVYHCAGHRIRKLYSMNLPNDSLGTVYMMGTRHLGYKMLGDEYKVMGMAAYGQPSKKFRDFFCDLIRLLPDGRYRVNPRMAGKVFSNGWKFPEHVDKKLGGRRLPDQPLTQEHRDFAFELQRRTEETILHIVRHVKKVTGVRHLCMAGGVALNSVANGKVRDEAGFADVFIPPAAHDAGTSLGAATYHHYYNLKGDRPQRLEHAYLGRQYDDSFIEQELRRCRQAYRRLESPACAAAQYLAAGRVVGWFQGAAEFGPRALGNRSILADPRRAETKDLVNLLVKEREGYRPFAPAILSEWAGDYLEHLTHSPFMLFVDSIRSERRAEIPAVVHADGTARPQTVTRETNSLFYSLIDEFRKLTNVPLVLNTSFNVAGEPIVNSPVDALRCFHACGLDVLVIGSFAIEKASL